MKIEKDVLLAPYSTVGLGGRAKFFAKCRSVDDLGSALNFGLKHNLGGHILGEGSNTLFADEGFDGLIIKIELKGIKIESRDNNEVRIKVAAGECWDDLVKLSVKNNWCGIEALSGIPGTVGAAPIQNIGAYGQEVAQTIQSVEALDRRTFKPVNFTNLDCQFAYRTSRFKTDDKNKYIITNVTFRLTQNQSPQINYEQLKQKLGRKQSPTIDDVRKAVLKLRRQKSMLIDKDDPNSRSLGSFFINPIIDQAQFASLQKQFKNQAIFTIPHFGTGNQYKIPAAWLVEQVGFAKGYQENGVGISSNHSLALININGTTAAILNLAKKIEHKVQQRFQINLNREPEIIDYILTKRSPPNAMKKRGH